MNNKGYFIVVLYEDADGLTNYSTLQHEAPSPEEALAITLGKIKEAYPTLKIKGFSVESSILMIDKQGHYLGDSDVDMEVMSNLNIAIEDDNE